MLAVSQDGHGASDGGDGSMTGVYLQTLQQQVQIEAERTVCGDAFVDFALHLLATSALNDYADAKAVASRSIADCKTLRPDVTEDSDAIDAIREIYDLHGFFGLRMMGFEAAAVTSDLFK